MKNLPVAQFFCGKSSDQLVMGDRLFQKGGQKKNVKCLCKNGQNGDPEWKKSCSWDFRGDVWTAEDFETVACKDQSYKPDEDEDKDEDKFAFSVWGVNSNDQIWFKSGETDMWKKNSRWPETNRGWATWCFGVNKNDAIWYRVGTNNNPYSSGTE